MNKHMLKHTVIVAEEHTATIVCVWLVSQRITINVVPLGDDLWAVTVEKTNKDRLEEFLRRVNIRVWEQTEVRGNEPC